jgi:DNA-binding response OmpR family regulator
VDLGKQMGAVLAQLRLAKRWGLREVVAVCRERGVNLSITNLHRMEKGEAKDYNLALLDSLGFVLGVSGAEGLLAMAKGGSTATKDILTEDEHRLMDLYREMSPDSKSVTIEAMSRLQRILKPRPRLTGTTSSPQIFNKDGEATRFRPASDSLLAQLGIPPSCPRCSGTVVIIDDSRASRERLTKRFDEIDPQLDVKQFEDGAEALAWMQDNQPLLVVADLNMPQLKGDELIPRIRAIRDLARVPIIIISVDQTPTARLAVFEAGATDFIGKDIDNQELRLRLRNWLDLLEELGRSRAGGTTSLINRQTENAQTARKMAGLLGAISVFVDQCRPTLERFEEPSIHLPTLHDSVQPE